MRTALPLSLFLTCMSASWAQAQPPVESSAGRDEKSAPAAGGKTAAHPEKRVETIRIEDAGARIDEVREGGETKSITVQPKGDVPAYEVVPEGGTRNPPGVDNKGAGGSRVWKILGF